MLEQNALIQVRFVWPVIVLSQLQLQKYYAPEQFTIFSSVKKSNPSKIGTILATQKFQLKKN